MKFLKTENDNKPECLRNQSTTIFLPHETECTKFYSCSNGLLTELECPKGTEFYPDKNVSFIHLQNLLLYLRILKII